MYCAILFSLDLQMSEIKRVVPRLASMAFKMNFADMVMEIKPVGLK